MMAFRVCCWMCLFAVCYAGKIYEDLVSYREQYPLPDLPYSYDGLEPHLDQGTLIVHHQGHHRAYTDKTNIALKEWREKEPWSSLAQSSIVEILRRITEVPTQWQTTLRNNGGGYVNHVLYWSTMCPGGGGKPSGKLLTDIEQNFGSFSAFEEQFSSEAGKLFGSGYAWLCEDNTGKLRIVPSHNQDCPLSDGLYPLLVLDVWEHAYYLRHQNKRTNYVHQWWSVVCWEEVEGLRQFWHRPHHQQHSEL